MSTITIHATIDSYMEGIVGPHVNFGSTVGTAARVVYAGGDKAFLARAIGNFSVSPVAADTINSASLWLYHYTLSGTPSTYISRCTRPADWVEDEVTWDDYSAGNAWTAGGGDVDDTTPTKVTFSLAAGSGWQEVTGLKAHVDDAIASRGNIVSLIVRLAGEDPGSSAGHIWRTKDFGSFTWYLTIDYTPAFPAGIPFERPSRASRAILRR